ncbi:MAG: hypothetical protein J6A98_00490 [Clostridia bacterium]|nr:hypothetical protein [Clostridia bacterium]
MEQQENSRFEKIYKGLYSLAESYVLIDKDLYKNIDKLNSDYFTNYHEKNTGLFVMINTRKNNL